MVASAIYEGTVQHRRHVERAQEFTHSLALAYLDTAEIPDLLNGRLVRRTPGALRYRREDYLGDPALPLDECVRATVAEHIGRRPTGAVRVLTQLRAFGHNFNPASFYYCFDDDDQLDAVVVEVTNTPWRERHCYVVDVASAATAHADIPKRLHVSPFLDMDQTYNFTLRPPSDSLFVHIENSQDGARVFDATLRLQRQPLDAATVRRITRRYPSPSRRALGLIYGHAVALRARGVKVRAHAPAVAK